MKENKGCRGGGRRRGYKGEGGGEEEGVQAGGD